MDWTKPADLVDQISRHWTQGRILAAKINGAPLFPLRLRLRAPDAKALGQRYEEVRAWVRDLEEGSRTKRGFGYDIEWVDINHRQLGRNRIPDRISISTEENALRLIGKTKDAQRFEACFKSTMLAFPILADWIARKPLTVLEHSDDWYRILAVLTWFRDHPQSGLYLRQVDIAAVDTKFIEGRRSLLAELLDVVAQQETFNGEAPKEARTFEQRFGLRHKPSLIRFRILDERLAINGLSDLTVPVDQLSRLSLPVRCVFITENEINGLAFPAVPQAIVIFGLGYSVDLLSSIDWLRNRDVHYWGDIDTHGFAMLDRLRAMLPTARSLLMDRETLLSHRSLWVQEATPHIGMLKRLTRREQHLFEDLQNGRMGDRIRLEQERISFGLLKQALDDVCRGSDPHVQIRHC